MEDETRWRGSVLGPQYRPGWELVPIVVELRRGRKIQKRKIDARRRDAPGLRICVDQNEC